MISAADSRKAAALHRVAVSAGFRGMLVATSFDQQGEAAYEIFHTVEDLTTAETLAVVHGMLLDMIEGLPGEAHGSRTHLAADQAARIIGALFTAQTRELQS